jgi:hypothetical protein
MRMLYSESVLGHEKRRNETSAMNNQPEPWVSKPGAREEPKLDFGDLQD